MAFTEPKDILTQCGIEPGMSAADFGAGTGSFTLPLARMVGSGTVYALDVQQDHLRKLQNDAREAGLSNVKVLWVDVENYGGTKIPRNILDVVVVANTLFAVENKKGMLEEALRVLKPGGKLVMIDWSDSFGNLGPRPEDVMSETRAKELAQSAGFFYEKTIDAGAHHYGLLFHA